MNVADALTGHAVVGLDTMIFVYYLEASSPLSDLTVQVLGLVETGIVQGVTAETTVMELMVRPFQIGRPDVAADYEAFLSDFPNLTIAPLPRATIRQAAELRAHDRLHALDALQVAACVATGATAFVTNDLRLRRLSVLDVVVLDDFLEPNETR